MLQPHLSYQHNCIAYKGATYIRGFTVTKIFVVFWESVKNDQSLMRGRHIHIQTFPDILGILGIAQAQIYCNEL